MTVEIKNFKEFVKNKKIKLSGSKKLSIPANFLSSFTDKVRANILAKANKKYEEYTQKLNQKKAGLYNEMSNKMPENLKKRYEEDIEYLKTMVNKWEKRLTKLQGDTSVLEFEVGNIKNFFPTKLNEKEAEKLQSYFDKETRTFKIGGQEFDPNVEEFKKADVYSKIIDKFRDVEENDYVKSARALKDYGDIVYGNDFIRLFSAKSKEKMEEIKNQLFSVYLDVVKELGVKKMKKVNKMDSKDRQKLLSKLNLPNFRENILSGEDKKTDLTKEQVDMNSKDTDTLEFEEYEYKVALEEARKHLEELEQTIPKQINQLRTKYLNNTESQAQAFGVWDGQVKYDNYDSLTKETEPLNKQLDDAKKAVRKAEDAYRMISGELRKRKSQELKDKHKLQDAKEFLSKLQVGTFKYDISKWSNEEILEKAEKIQKEMDETQQIANTREEEATIIEKNKEPLELPSGKEEIIANLMETANLTEEQAIKVANSDSQIIQTVIDEFYTPQDKKTGKTK